MHTLSGDLNDNAGDINRRPNCLISWEDINKISNLRHDISYCIRNFLNGNHMWQHGENLRERLLGLLQKERPLMKVEAEGPRQWRRMKPDPEKVQCSLYPGLVRIPAPSPP
eukprot:GHVU01013289.1.p1 GENE.GHVU01013289.1~~GHVU01013289.1.p1  ORF type:complete len:111 (-),score=13.03 GHVU01013289.1:151-483(-)